MSKIKKTSVLSSYDSPRTLLEYLKDVRSQNEEIIDHNEEIDAAIDGCAKKNESNTFRNNNFFYGWFLARGQENEPDWGEIESVSGIVSLRTFNPNTNEGYSLFVHPYFGVGASITYNHGEENEYTSTFNLPTKPQGNYTLATTDDIVQSSTRLEDIEDSEGHKRFQSFGIVPASQDIEMYYSKCILNGLTMTIVMYFKALALFGSTNIGYCELPSWILDKLIVEGGGADVIVAHYGATRYNSGGTYQYVADYGNVIKEQDRLRLTTDVTVAANTLVRVSITLGL